MKKKKILFAGKVVPERELIDLLRYIPEKDQEKIYEYANGLRNQNQFVFEYKKESYQINLSQLAYVCKQGNALLFYSVNSKLLLRVPRMTLYELENILSENKSVSFVHAYTTILFKPAFYSFSYSGEIKKKYIKEYLLEYYKLKYSVIILTKIFNWLKSDYSVKDCIVVSV